MTEKIPQGLPSDPDKLKTPQEKLEMLLHELEKFEKPPYQAMDPMVVERAQSNVLDAIAELKQEYPELNN